MDAQLSFRSLPDCPRAYVEASGLQFFERRRLLLQRQTRAADHSLISEKQIWFCTSIGA